MPSTEPDGWRRGMAWARTNTREPSTRRTANVPSPPRPRSTCLASSAAFPASPPLNARDSTGRPSSLPPPGKPNSATANGLAYRRLPCRSVTTTAAEMWARMVWAGR